MTMRKLRDKKVDSKGRVGFITELREDDYQWLRRYAFDEYITKADAWDRIMFWFFDPANGVCNTAPERQWGHKKS